MTPSPPDRRSFLTVTVAGLAGAVLPGRRGCHRSLRAILWPGPHPTPRKGYTAEKVLAADKLDGDDLVELFDGIRKIPQVVDGIRCHCGCADMEGMYSLLTCYEGDEAMATWCPICQGQGRLVVRLDKAGKTLDEIRRAIDARY